LGFKKQLRRRRPPDIENTLVPDGGQGWLGDVDAVVVDPTAHPNTDQPPEHVLEWRAVENVEEVDRVQLPDALDPPETGVVDRADGRRRAERFEATLHQGVVNRGDASAEREEQSHDRVRKHVLEEFEGGQVDEYDQEDAQPPREQEDADRPEVESVLCGKAEAQRLPRPEMVESAVRISFSNAMPHVSGGHLRGVWRRHIIAVYVYSGRELPRSAAAFPEAGENKRGGRA